MKMTLRTKIMSALLLCSLSAVALVALVTPPLLEQRFLNQTRQTHFANFERQIAQYISRNPDWGGRQSALDYNRRVIMVHRQRQAERPGPPPLQDPFASDRLRYVLADHLGYVFHPFYDYEAGQRLTDAEQEEAWPLYMQDRQVGWALPRGSRLSEHDEAYLALLQRSLLTSGGLAVCMALLLGWLITRPMTVRLARLTEAVRTLKVDTPTTTPPDSGHDEIATLNREFARMSNTLTEQFRDLTESHATISKQASLLEKLSYTDPLTGLYNRRHFDEQLEQCWDRSERDGRPLALILLDVDHFKRINDRFSHQIGDAVLKAIAGVLQQAIRSHDILARYGGEELVLLMPDTRPGQAKEVGQRMRKCIEQYHWSKLAIGLVVTASFGVANATPGSSPRVLLKQADDQLYKAKEAGRNRVCVA